MKDPELLTIQEASIFLDVHPETLRRWDNSGKLPAIKTNSRGDRKYKLEDLMRIKASLTPHSYKSFEITPWSLGFEMFTDRFGSVSSYIVKNKSTVSGFAFAIGGLDWFAEPALKEKNLQKMALDTIMGYIDAQAVVNGKEYTFEFKSSHFTEEPNALWWKKGGTG